MNNRENMDAFENLINKMKEADSGDGFHFGVDSAAPPAPKSPKPEGYPVTRRPSAPRELEAGGYPVTRRVPRPAAPQTQEPPPRPRAPRPAAPAPMARQAREGNFEVNIRNNEFDGLPDAPPSRARRRAEPPRSGGGVPPTPPPRRPSGSGAGRWLRALTVAGIAVAISIFLAFFVIISASDLFGLNQPDEPVDVSITEGMTFKQVVDKLADLDILSSPLTFNLYSGLKKDKNGVKISENFKSGDYAFNKNMSYDELITMLRLGIDDTEIVSLPFPEGLTIQSIAKRLEEGKVCTAQEFVDEIRNGNFSEYDFITAMPPAGSEDRYYVLEGFIFPDTYDFYVGEEPSVTVRRFLDNFEKKMTDDLQAKMKKRGMTLYETVTLASIIQKEAGAIKDMGAVSSVFRNRMANPKAFPMLESDVTTFYVRDTIMPNFPDRADEPLDGKNNFMAAYSTYYRDGLPVGPICNPGMDAIEAALDPDETPYYFFVTDDKGTYYYAETANQHAENVAVAMPSGDAHGTGVEQPKQ